MKVAIERKDSGRLRPGARSFQMAEARRPMPPKRIEGTKSNLS